MNEDRFSERRTSYVAIHPYYGYVLKPNSTVDFGLRPPEHFGHGVSIATDHKGFRNTGTPESKPDNEIWIGLFGGSVAMSVLSSDNSKTISGFLETEMNSGRAAGGKRVRVINFALPGGQQPQQLMIFLNNIGDLDGIITFDGYNEITVPLIRNIGYTPDWFPYFPYYYELFSEKADDDRQGLVWILRFLESKKGEIPFPFRLVTTGAINIISRWIKNRLNRIADYSLENFSSLYLAQPAPHDRNPIKIMDEGAARWRGHILLMHDIASARGIDSLFILQPIPETGKILTEAEQGFLSSKKEFSDTRVKGYERLARHGEALKDAGVNFHDFADIFKDVEGEIYGDITHFEDRGCKIAARRIADIILKAWGTFK